MNEPASLNRPTTREEEAIRFFLQGMLRESMQSIEALLRDNPSNLIALDYQATIQELLAWGIAPSEPLEEFGTVLRLYHEKKYQAAQRWLANLLQAQPNRPEYRTMYLLLSEKILHDSHVGGSGGMPALAEGFSRSGTIATPDPMGRLARWIFLVAGFLLAAQLVIFFVFYPRLKRAESEEAKQRLQQIIPQEFNLPEIDQVLRYYQIAKAYYQEKMYDDARDALKEARRFPESIKKIERLVVRLEEQVKIAPLFELAQQFYEAKVYDKASEKIAMILKIDVSHNASKELQERIKARLKEQKELQESKKAKENENPVSKKKKKRGKKTR